MNILLLGSGGREHAFAWKILQSRKVGKLYVAPGNAGIDLIAECVNILPTDFESIKSFCLKNNINLLIVGPEDPLVKGIYDYFKNDKFLNHIPVIGPSKTGARLEGSKDFAKQFMLRHNIPTARYQSFTKNETQQAFAFLETLKAPYVLKADGLAAGKGVLILDNIDEAKTELTAMLDGMFGNASNTVVIEEFLTGIECSVFVLTDGDSYKILPVAKDYKRVGEGDTGLNTGGMGAISPVSFADDAFMKKVETQIIKPTIDGLKIENIDYKGFIFIGLIKVGCEPMVIEYNVRMGDPETEVVMLRIKSDIVQLMQAVANQTLNTEDLEIDNRYAATVMLVAGGYPEKYESGNIIENLSDVTPESIIFHAGSKKEGNNLITNGGRLLAISSYGKTKEEALEKSYKNAEIVSYEHKYYRKDIGYDLE